ncbi:DUF484 family protein [Candidatus Marithrix sp. Canyon 246]|uniref:DUF484 family protein n=1 Tax=Candidatus Marithrix sp. Canyon 246 TaxID=1827136 RepID=UPI00084A2013|nr:DUF484 family protein [Candidatus Marithrix sp. Canyon 246]
MNKLSSQEVAVLRQDNEKLKSQLNELITIAQENEELNQRIQRLITALTNTESLDEFFNILYSTLNNELNTDAVVIRWFDVLGSNFKHKEFVEYDAQIFSLFDEILENKQAICGQLKPEQLAYLFPKIKVASAVLIPLGVDKPLGLLAMASHDRKRFHSEMSTDFLIYLGNIISNLLRMWTRNR